VLPQAAAVLLDTLKPCLRPVARDPFMPAPPEHWEADAAEGDVAQLHIPDDPLRERRFEIFCSFSVDGGGREGAWHALRVLVNGAQQWQRREDTQPGGRDSLDYRFRYVLPAGEPLRVVASTRVQLARRLRLLITADED
jgi:hypothetical protein